MPPHLGFCFIQVKPTVLNSNPHASMTLSAAGSFGITAHSKRTESFIATALTGSASISSSGMVG